MNHEDEDHDVDESQSIEMRRRRSRLSSKRTREKERSLMDALESERVRLYLSNTALRYHNGHLFDAIQAIKKHRANPNSLGNSASSSHPSENSFIMAAAVPRNVQYNPMGGTGAQQVMPSNLNASLPRQPINQLGSSMTGDLNQIAQNNPLHLPGTGPLSANMLQQMMQQPAFHSALQAEMNRRFLPGGQLNFPMAQVQPQQPINLAAAAAAAAALAQWQQLPPGVNPRRRPRDPDEDN